MADVTFMGFSHRAEISMKKPRVLKCVRLIVRNQGQGVMCTYMQADLQRTFSNIIPVPLYFLMLACSFNSGDVRNNLCEF